MHLLNQARKLSASNGQAGLIKSDVRLEVGVRFRSTFEALHAVQVLGTEDRQLVLVPFLQGAHSLLRRIEGETENIIRAESSYLLPV